MEEKKGMKEETWSEEKEGKGKTKKWQKRRKWGDTVKEILGDEINKWKI